MTDRPTPSPFDNPEADAIVGEIADAFADLLSPDELEEMREAAEIALRVHPVGRALGERVRERIPTAASEDVALPGAPPHLADSNKKAGGDHE